MCIPLDQRRSTETLLRGHSERAAALKGKKTSPKVGCYTFWRVPLGSTLTTSSWASGGVPRVSLHTSRSPREASQRDLTITDVWVCVSLMEHICESEALVASVAFF